MLHARLREILSGVEEGLEHLRRASRKWGSLERACPVRDFKGAISPPGRTALVSEIKFASPSAGRIRHLENPVRLALDLETAGASALSVVTERNYFAGDPNTLDAVSRAASIPVLRKDFILDEVQIEEAYLRGADAVLLIVRILAPGRLSSLLRVCRAFGLSALVEVHDKEEIYRALEAGTEIVGINNRDLDTFHVSLERTREIAHVVPRSRVLVSESGISTREDIAALRELGVHAVLVGTTIMEADDPARKTSELVSAGC